MVFIGRGRYQNGCASVSHARVTRGTMREMVRSGWIVVCALGAGCQFETGEDAAGVGLGESMGSTSDATAPTSSAVTTASDTSVDPSTPTDPDPDPSVSTSSTDPTTGLTTGLTTSDPQTDTGDSDATTTGVTPVGSSSSSSTGEPLELQVAEELIVSLDATNGNASNTGWINDGTMDDFVPVGSPTVEEVDGIVAVTISADNLFRSTQAPPATLVEPNSTRTIEVWAFDPMVGTDEPMVSWGHRNGPDGTILAFNFGTHPLWGAVTHWGSPDLGWSAAPQASMWHHLVYTFDGETTRVYVDGVLDNEEFLGEGAIDTHDDDNILIGAQFREDGQLTNFASLSVARVRVHGGVLTDDQIAINYALESAELGQ